MIFLGFYFSFYNTTLNMFIFKAKTKELSNLNKYLFSTDG